MLPNELSDDLCSLKPNVNRMAVVCEIVINQYGIVESFKFYESIINSKDLLMMKLIELLKTILSLMMISNYF